MIGNRIAVIPLLTIVASASWLTTADVAGQTANATTTTAVPRTPWGDPDLQGLWTGSTLTPLERPKTYADKEFLTEAEAEALEKRSAEGRVDAPPRPGDPGTYNQVWFDPATRVLPNRRTSLVVDPPDGRIPFTAAGRLHTDVSSARYGVGPYESHADLDTGERCLTDGIPIWYSGYNNNYQIVQTREHLVVLGELYSNLRIIPLDRRAHVALPLWLGSSRGRWQGGTLVVETIHFADKAQYWWATAWRASRPTLRLVERFTRVDARTIDYEFTMEDPTMFTRPWTARWPLTTDQAARGVTSGPLYEYACHEGNYAMVNILKGARAREQAARRSGSR